MLVGFLDKLTLKIMKKGLFAEVGKSLILPLAMWMIPTNIGDNIIYNQRKRKKNN